MMLDDEVQIDEYAEEQDDGRVPSQYASIDIGEHLGRIGDRLLRHNVRRCLQRAGERSKVVLDAYRERDSAIKQQWGKRRLREGDLLASVDDAMQPAVRRRLDMVSRSRREGVRQHEDQRPGSHHPNRWTIPGTLQMAFAYIRAGSSKMLRQSHNEIAALSMVSLAHRESILDHAKHLSMDIELSPRSSTSWVVLERAWDLTPLTVNFGNFASRVRPYARYWWQEKVNRSEVGPAKFTGQWRQLTFEEYQATFKSHKPTHGVLQCMAQTFRLSWLEFGDKGFPVLRMEQPVISPIWMAGKGSSCTWSALEKSGPQMQWDDITKMAMKLGVVVLCLGGDLDSGNVRVKHFFGQQAKEFNDDLASNGCKVLILDVMCASHIIHRITEVAFETTTLIPSLHATAFTATQTKFFDCMLYHLRETVKEDLQCGGFVLGRDPDPASKAHTLTILDFTVHRHKWTRARHQQESPDFRSDAMAAELAIFLNGDWRSGCIEHFCQGPRCCKNLDICTEKVTALLKTAVFDHLNDHTPSCNRWHTFGRALESQGLGLLCHSILSRVSLRAALGSNEEVVGDDDDSLPFKAYCSRKEKQSSDFLGDYPASTVAVATALVITEPTDHLSQRMQHLDTKTHAVTEMMSKSGPLFRCQQQMWDLLRPSSPEPSSRGGLGHDMFAHHFADSPDFRVYMEQFYSKVVRVSSQVWSRLEVMYQQWPWRLLLAGDRCKPVRAAEVLLEFYNEDACCLDSWFSEHFRSVYPTPESVNEEAQLLLAQLARKCARALFPIARLSLALKGPSFFDVFLKPLL